MKRFYELVAKHFNQGIELKEGSDFAYYRKARIIVYSLYAPTDGVNGMYNAMTELVQDKYKEYIESIPICILCILHEYGHHFTNILDDELDNYLDEVDIINKMLAECTNETDKAKITELYRRLPLEKSADEWAVNFAIKHKNLIIDWIKFGQKYVDNDVTI